MQKPVLQAMVLADHVYQDRATGKFIIAGTFTRMFVGTRKAKAAGDGSGNQLVSGPVTTSGSPYLYLALVELSGKVPLELKYLRLSDAKLIFSIRLVLGCDSPLKVAEYNLPIPPLSTEPGDYSLDLLCDNEILGSWRVKIDPVKDEETGVESKPGGEA